MIKILFIFILSFFLNFNAFGKVKNIGNGLSVNVPNKYKYFELTLKQLVSRFPDINNDPIYEELGIGLNSKLIIISNNQKTVNFFNDVTSVNGLEKLNRRHLQPMIKKFTSESFLKKFMRDMQKMYPNKNFDNMSEDELMQLIGEISENPKMIRKYEKLFKPFRDKFNKEYKFERYTIIILGDKPADQIIEELNSYEISEMKENFKVFVSELYEEYKDPSLYQIQNWKFEIDRNHNGDLYLYSDDSMQSPYVSNKFEQEVFITTYDNKIFLGLSICSKNCKNSTDFQTIIEPTNLLTKANNVKKITKSQNENIVEQLNSLNELYKSGVLTKEEFEKAKKKILN
jgi:hypothetical protein